MIGQSLATPLLLSCCVFIAGSLTTSTTASGGGAARYANLQTANVPYITSGRARSRIDRSGSGRFIARTIRSGRYVSFPNAGIKLIKPNGFDAADGFDGFQQPSTTSSVMVVKIPGSFDRVTSGFTAEQLKAKGMTLQSKENIKIDGEKGLLISVTQTAYGIEFMKWMLVFGNDKDTKIVTATFPNNSDAKLSANLKSIVMSAKLDTTAPSATGADSGFTIVASDKLKLTTTVNKVQLYTKDGVIPAKSPADPLFVVAPSFSRVTIADKQQFAVRRLYQTAHTKIGSVTATNPITIDGLNGYEISATGEDSDSGTPLAIYQVMLFDDKSYFLMQGLVGSQLRGEYLPAFQRMSYSFKRQRK
jgi:hypothetical protein